MSSDALFSAIASNNFAAADELLAAGVDVNAPIRQGELPLVLAARLGHRGMAIKMLEAGADINGRNSKGNTALIMATLLQQTEMVRFLLGRGADVHIRGNSGLDAMESASHHPRDDVRKMLAAVLDRQAREKEAALQTRRAHLRRAAAARRLTPGAAP